jgi:pyrimidine operon attenuation protein / uracil phosphoribosyltransferase
MSAARQLMGEDDVRRTLVRIAHEILERNADTSQIALVGIHTRGLFVAQRLKRLLHDIAAVDVPLGSIDITFHRDDVSVRSGKGSTGPQPVVRGTRLEFPIDDHTIVLCDDVLSTGRTIRAAIETLFTYGRPGRVQLAVLVDRGHRELPIRPDFVGKNLPTAAGQWIQVEMVEHDEVDRVLLQSGKPAPATERSSAAQLTRA